jgi:hypothetical protein
MEFVAILVQECNVAVIKVLIDKFFILLTHFLGFVGTGCQFELDACHSDVCKNGASCVEEKNGSYKCICAPGK